MYKINLNNDTYIKLPNIIASLNARACAISYDGSIIAFLSQIVRGQIDYDVQIRYCLRNADDTYTLQSKIVYSKNYRIIYSRPIFMFTSSNALICATMMNNSSGATVSDGCFLSANFSNVDNITVNIFSQGSQTSVLGAVSDISGKYCGRIENKAFALLYSPDGGVTPYSTIGSVGLNFPASYQITRTQGDISPKNNYIVTMDKRFDGVAGTGRAFVKADGSVLALTSYGYDDTTYSDGFYDPSGNYFLVKIGNNTHVFDALETPPYIDKPPVAVLSFAINYKKQLSANGEVAAFIYGSTPYSSRGLVRIKNKVQIEKLTDVYRQSVLLKNEIGIALKNANAGQPCKVNLFSPINSKLGNLL